MMLKCDSCRALREEKDIETIEYELFPNCHRFYHYCADRPSCKVRADICAERKLL